VVRDRHARVPAPHRRRQRHEPGLNAWVVQHIQDPETANGLIEDCYEIFGLRREGEGIGRDWGCRSL
jgi:hypothetical protein